MLWRFQSGASALSGLSLAVGVALMRALHDMGIKHKAFVKRGHEPGTPYYEYYEVDTIGDLAGQLGL